MDGGAIGNDMFRNSVGWGVKDPGVGHWLENQRGIIGR